MPHSTWFKISFYRDLRCLCENVLLYFELFILKREMLAETHQSFKVINIDICIWVKTRINQALIISQLDSG